MSGPTADIAVLIPALDEEDAIALVVRDALAAGAARVLVVDNGSRDDTVNRARAAGARVVREARRGYGSACLRGIEEYQADPPDILVFLDGDYSDYPEDLPALVAPIAAGRADLVIGSRILGGAPRDAMVPQARFGNWLASRLLATLYGVHYTDLGPFRAIRWETLGRLGMQDPDFGWTVEMQVKAAKLAVPYCEVPVRYRARVGKSKISGTVKGTVRAGHKILWTIARERWLA
jgi:glycosyltransferase involved in cell wall biosynthesis